MLTKRWAILDIWEPKYSTMEVLLATRKIGERNRVNIQKGAYKGQYFVSGDIVRSCPIQSNGKISVYAVPLSQLEREE